MPFHNDRETTITQEIPIIVLAAAAVEAIHEPKCPQPDVHIMLPPLLQLKAISERFTKLALSTSTSAPAARASATAAEVPTPYSSSTSSRLILSANAHGVLRIGVETASLRIESRWEGLTNPELDPEQIEGGVEGVKGHASTKMKERRGEESWSVVRVEGRDWGRVLGVGRLGGRVIACEYLDDHLHVRSWEDWKRSCLCQAAAVMGTSTYTDFHYEASAMITP